MSENRDDGVLEYQAPRGVAGGFKTVWVARDAMEANLAVATLQERGIHARVENENLNATAPHLAVAISASVQVPLGDVEEARMILKEIDARRQDRQQAMKVACPRCGQRKAVGRIPPTRHIGTGLAAATIILALINQGAFMVFTLPLAFLLWLWPVTPRWRCSACGARFAAAEPEILDEDGD